MDEEQIRKAIMLVNEQLNNITKAVDEIKKIINPEPINQPVRHDYGNDVVGNNNELQKQ